MQRLCQEKFPHCLALSNLCSLQKNQKTPTQASTKDLTMETTELLDRFAELKRIEKSTKDELDSIKAEVIKAIEAANGEVKTDAYVMKLGKRETYEYTVKVKELEAVLKEAKAAVTAQQKIEKEGGHATVANTTVFPTFKDLV